MYGAEQLKHAKRKLVAVDIDRETSHRQNAGDRVVNVDFDSPIPSDLIITFDNSAGVAKKYALIGGALPNHATATGKTIDLTPSFNFGMTNDKLKEYLKMDMGIKIRAIDREVTSSAASYASIEHLVVTGVWNDEKDVDIASDLNRTSSMDQDRKISNVVFPKGEELTLDKFHSWVIGVPAGETLVLTLRIGGAKGFPYKV